MLGRSPAPFWVRFCSQNRPQKPKIDPQILKNGARGGPGGVPGEPGGALAVPIGAQLEAKRPPRGETLIRACKRHKGQDDSGQDGSGQGDSGQDVFGQIDWAPLLQKRFWRPGTVLFVSFG